MPDFENFLARGFAFHAADLGQDRIAHRIEGLRDQRRADDAGRMAGAHAHHLAAPALRHRQRHQEAHQVDDVLDVIVEADALGRIGADARAVFRRQPGRPADAGVIARIFRQRRTDHAFAEIGFDQNQRLAVFGLAVADAADIERGMRPGGLGEIFDDAGDVVVAFDQQHVAGLQRVLQGGKVARREGLIALHRLFQIAGQKLPDSVEHEAHGLLPARGVSAWRLFSCSFVESRCSRVHGAHAAVTAAPIVCHCKVSTFPDSEAGRKASGNHVLDFPQVFPRFGAGAAVAPVLGGLAMAAETDVAIVGAGAAGIAAARSIQALGRRAVLLEAADRVGGRCITDTATFGMPYDLGAHWLRAPDRNPVAKLVIGTGLEIYPAPPGQKMRIGRRNAREGELEEYLSILVRARRAIEDAARGKTDISLAQAMPKDLGEWQPSVEFFLGPFAFGKDFNELSVMDFVRSNERDSDAYCRQGFGALLAKLAEGLNVQLVLAGDAHHAAAARRHHASRPRKGALQARAVIVTVSTNVLAEGKLAFASGVPKRHMDAASRLRLGNYERVALEIPGNPFGLARDDLVFEKADGKRTAALARPMFPVRRCPMSISRVRSAAILPPRDRAR